MTSSPALIAQGFAAGSGVAVGSPSPSGPLAATIVDSVC